jgi:NAD(P)-dependent dehydrogenase (short-subunit alcohol dehydrogenase family)
VTRRPTTIVTGAASGIGRATAERLRNAGWAVIGIDVRDEMPPCVIGIVGDATDQAILQLALSEAGGQLEGLVCAAGAPPRNGWDDVNEWNELLRVDLGGPYHALRLCLPALVAQRGSAVIVGSIVGSAEGSYRSPAYAAAKAGLGGLVRSMALIGADQGVRVNLVEPGAIDTPFDPPDFPVNDRPDVPLGRMGTADEVAAAIFYLLSDDASYVTGTTLRVDGGRTIAKPLSGRQRGETRPEPGASTGA